MVDRKPPDSSRDLLEELEDGWATPSPGKSLASEAREARSPSTPDVAELDDGWLDDLFPGEKEEEEEEEEEEPEPELPDEKVDPEAFARAKKARDERAAKKKDKKRAKLEAKRGRQKARLVAMQQKQKSKKARAPGSAKASEARSPVSKRERVASEPQAAVTAEDEEADDLAVPGLPVAKPRARVPANRKSTAASIRLLAIVLGVLLALAALVAALVK